jgi:hypothetical protein
VLPELLKRLATETDVGLQMAFAAALGRLGATEAIGRLLALLRASDTHDARMEFTLALARLVGDEHRFIQLQRRVMSEPGTALSQEVTALKGKLAKSPYSGPEIEGILDTSAEVLAQEDVAGGVQLFASALQMLPAEHLPGACSTVVRECARQVREWGSGRIEYVLLGLHAVDCVVSG